MSALLALTIALQLPAAPAQPVEKREKPPREKRICRDAPVTTGSRMSGRRLCKTQAEWDRAGSDQGLEALQGQGQIP